MKQKRILNRTDDSRVSIHTSITVGIYNKLMEAGNGNLNSGIKNILEIAESKQYNVKTELKKIAEKILYEIRDIDS